MTKKEFLVLEAGEKETILENHWLSTNQVGICFQRRKAQNWQSRTETGDIKRRWSDSYMNH